jgi:hypothetical protein
MEKEYIIKLNQSTLDILTGLIDIVLKTKGLEVLGSVTTLTNHIQQNITELPQEQPTPAI